MKPFIHLFNSSESYYFYDVNTDSIIEIDQELFNDLKLQQEKPEYMIKNRDSNIKIDNLKKAGFLKHNQVKESEHPATEFIEFYLKSYVSTLILQVTQNCNLRCEYCIYSGSYKNRVHNNKRMNFEMAKKGIDYLILHSSDCPILNISFYGGEPLLEMELIKKSIAYANDLSIGKEINYSLTTNGTLLTIEEINFFVENNVSLVFSLDGPEDVHNKSRKFLDGKGSFDLLISNILFIKESYPDYYRTHVSYSTVLNVENGFSCVDDFISYNELFEESFFSASIINPNYSKRGYLVSEDYLVERRYEDFKVFLSKLGKLSNKDISKIADLEFEAFMVKRKESKYGTRRELPEKFHHSGPCIPGTFRLFLTVDGDFYPCERVSEISKLAKLGNIDTGIDVEAAKKMLNVELFSTEKCRECWAYSNCEVCIAFIDDTEEFSEKLLNSQCRRIRDKFEGQLKDYCVLESLLKNRQRGRRT